MKRFAVAGALVAALAGCGDETVLTSEDGTRWEPSLAIGETRIIGANVIVRGFGAIDSRVYPANTIDTADAAVVRVVRDRYGFAITGLARGRATLRAWTEVGEIDAEVDVD